MNITEITVENKSEFARYINGDILENIGRKYYRGLACFEDEVFTGAMIFELKYAEDVFVDTESRIILFICEDEIPGEYLLEEYEKVIGEYEVKKSCLFLSGFVSSGEEEVLRDAGFTLAETESPYVVVNVRDLSEHPLFKDKESGGDIKSIQELSARNYRRGIVDCILSIHRDVTEDLESLPLEWYDKELSCYEESEGDVSGFLLVHKMASGGLRVELLAAWRADSQASLMNMMKFAINQAAGKYDDETDVVLYRHDESSIKLIQYLFKSAVGQSVFTGERTEYTAVRNNNKKMGA